MPLLRRRPSVPDFCKDANAVLKDKIPSWRYGQPPDYTNTRNVYRLTKSQNHPPGSPEDMVENLVKNWEVEASFKQDINDWRTIDKNTYQFSVNGGKPSGADHMLKVGTYNAVITSNEYYSPEHSDFNSSHKTFKRMMPTFAWEVMAVYGEPPNLSFRWRHWGVMKNDYVGFNEAGEKVTVRAHGGTIDFQGVTVARLTDDMRIQSLDTYFDPMEMFKQIGRGRTPEKVAVGRLGKYKLLPGESHNDYHGMDDHIQKFPENNPLAPPAHAPPPPPQYSAPPTTNGYGSPPPPPPQQQQQQQHPRKVTVEDYHSQQQQIPIRPISPAESHHTTHTLDSITYEEMSKMTPLDCPFLMKWRDAVPSGESREPSEFEEPLGGDDWGHIESAVVCETIVEED